MSAFSTFTAVSAAVSRSAPVTRANACAQACGVQSARRPQRVILSTAFVPSVRPVRTFSAASRPQALPSFPTPPVAAFDAAPLEERAMTKKYEWPEGAEIKLLYDGECPICVKEVDFLKSKDKAGKIIFEDIADPNYDPAMNGGVSWDEAMDKIHAVLPDGSSVVGMEVFRRTYKAIGLGWIYAPTAWPGLRPVFDRVYDVWAANRLTITGRPKCGKDGCELKL